MAETILILASRSPRRAQLLCEAGYVFTQRDPPYEDPPQPEGHGLEHAQSMARSLASDKARSLPNNIDLQQKISTTILAADTICLDEGGQLIGQPRSRSHAQEIIENFARKSHQVVTAVALLRAQSPIKVFDDTARVRLGAIDPKTLADYIETDQWRGKAGGYNLFERQAAEWPLFVTGDPTTVVGLPMRRLEAALAQWSIRPHPRPVERRSDCS